jgi:hypothetical protein
MKHLFPFYVTDNGNGILLYALTWAVACNTLLLALYVAVICEVAKAVL